MAKTRWKGIYRNDDKYPWGMEDSHITQCSWKERTMESWKRGSGKSASHWIWLVLNKALIVAHQLLQSTAVAIIQLIGATYLKPLTNITGGVYGFCEKEASGSAKSTTNHRNAGQGYGSTPSSGPLGHWDQERGPTPKWSEDGMQRYSTVKERGKWLWNIGRRDTGLSFVAPPKLLYCYFYR